MQCTILVMTNMAAQLDYAPGEPLRRRRRIRWAIWFVLLIALLFAGLRFGPRAWREGRLFYLERRCLTYAAPADQVVYEQDSPAIAERLERPGYRQFSVPFDHGDYSLESLNAIYLMPDALKDFSPYLPRYPSIEGATLFLHERKTKSGVKRLVILQRKLVLDAWGPRYVFGIDVIVIDPDTRSFPKSPDPISSSLFTLPRYSPIVLAPTKGLRFYAGQVDPRDDAHFTIRYELDGRAGVIDGRLNDFGNDVDLRVVDGPGVNTKWVRNGTAWR